MKKQIQQIIDAVKESQRILIVGHVSPDGDCFGSMFALGMELERQGKYVRTSAGEGLTDKYNFMRDYLNCCAAKDLDEEDFDLVIAVDTADDYRVGSILEPIFKKQPLKISIDHHMTNPGFSDINWVEERSATGELIYELLKEMDAPITVRTANALYAAIMTDTGNFIYSNTTPETLCLAAELVSIGAEVQMLAEEIYNKRSLGATKLMGAAIDTIKLYHDGKIAIMYADYAMIEGCGAVPADCESLINFAREIDTVEIAMLVREINKTRYKVSLRSKKYADVAQLAGFFGGGGHHFAAGCTLDGTMEEVMQRMLMKAEELI